MNAPAAAQKRSATPAMSRGSPSRPSGMRGSVFGDLEQRLRAVQPDWAELMRLEVVRSYLGAPAPDLR